MFQGNTTFEKFKIEAENHGFLNVEVLGFCDNGTRLVFSYDRKSDNERRIAGILLRKDGKFRAHTYRGGEWIISVRNNKADIADIFGEITK